MHRNLIISLSIAVVLEIIVLGAVANVSGSLMNAVLVLSPVCCTMLIATMYVAIIWQRDKSAPFFDLGLYMVFAILLYSVIPPLQFTLSGYKHSVFSARQLFDLQPDVGEFGRFTWRYVLYMAGFVLMYLKCRQTDTSVTMKVNPPDKLDVFILVMIYLVMEIIFAVLKNLYGVDYKVTYSTDTLDAQFANLQQLPGIIQQFYGHFLGISFIVNIAIMAALFSNWRKRFFRYTFVIWIASLFIGYYFKPGARTELVLIIMVSLILFNRLVKRISVTRMAAGGALILTLFLAMGELRGGVSNEKMDVTETTVDYRTVAFSMANEFQTLFAGAYDITKMVENGILTDVPLQLNLVELFMLIPQQLLPFEKVDVAEWYLANSTTRGFFMLNPVAQGAIGLGLMEIIARSALLGWFFARIHNYYLANGNKFWSAVFYSWMISQSYYSIRSSSFYFLAFIVYRFIPFILLVLFLRHVISVICRHNDVAVT